MILGGSAGRPTPAPTYATGPGVVAARRRRLPLPGPARQRDRELRRTPRLRPGRPARGTGAHGGPADRRRRRARRRHDRRLHAAAARRQRAPPRAGAARRPAPGVLHRAELTLLAAPAAFGAAVRGLRPGGPVPWATFTKQDRRPPRLPHPGAGRRPARPRRRLRRARRAAARRRRRHLRRGQPHAIWAQRFLTHRAGGRQLAPRNGSMGYGIPAAVAAALRHPGRRVVSIAGDGCFLMNGQELATAVTEGAAPADPRPEQLPVRNHPPAPGADLSRPGQRHRPRQPRLRRVRPGLRRPRRDRHRHRGVRAGPGSRPGLRPGRPHRAEGDRRAARPGVTVARAAQGDRRCLTSPCTTSSTAARPRRPTAWN